MFTPEEVDELFAKRKDAADCRWIFTPHWQNGAKSYRYCLTFIPRERRYTLSRQKIEPFIAVNDDDLTKAFESQLSADDMAACMRAAINPPPDDDLPF